MLVIFVLGAAGHVKLPALPCGVHLSLCEALDVVERFEATAGELHPDADQEESSASITGATVWPCASVLCHWMRDNAAVVQGAQVLELGAGTGACGLYAAGLGSAHVMLTDGREGLLALQAENFRRAKAVLPDSASVSMETYRWGTTVPPPGPWNLVLASDTTYDGDNAAVLARALHQLLRQPTAPAAKAEKQAAATAAPRIILAHDHRAREAADLASLLLDLEDDDGAPPAADEAPATWEKGDSSLERFLACTAAEGLRVVRLWSDGPPGEPQEVSILEVM